ncbi:hypothetical protein BMO78_001815 [Escherichia coli]|nr:hypothetical protein [Escherichia coli]
MSLNKIRPIRLDGDSTIAEVNVIGDDAPVSWSDIQEKPETFTPPAATESVIGGVKKAATQANSVASDVSGVVADFNSLLAKLNAAGIMA